MGRVDWSNVSYNTYPPSLTPSLPPIRPTGAPSTSTLATTAHGMVLGRHTSSSRCISTPFTTTGRPPPYAPLTHACGVPWYDAPPRAFLPSLPPSLPPDLSPHLLSTRYLRLCPLFYICSLRTQPFFPPSLPPSSVQGVCYEHLDRRAEAIKCLERAVCNNDRCRGRGGGRRGGREGRRTREKERRGGGAIHLTLTPCLCVASMLNLCLTLIPWVSL